MRGPFFSAAAVLFSGLLLAQEMQIPLDEEGRVHAIERELARALDLFSGYSGFREAGLFRLPDGRCALEIYYLRNGRLFKERLILSPVQADSIRREVSARIRMRRPAALQDRKGRSRFLVRTFLLGYGFYSWAVPVSFDLEGRAAQVGALLTGSAGFLLPFSLTGRIPVGQAAASLGGHGGLTGIAHGILFSELLFGQSDSFRRKVASGMGGSVGGLVSGFVLAHRSRMSAGTAELIGWGGNYGLGIGWGSAHLLGFLDGAHRREAALTALLGSGLGYWGGYALAERRSYTRGDAGLLVEFAILGASSAASLAYLAAADRPRLYTGAAMAGSVAGLGLGDLLLRDRAFSIADSRMAVLGAAGGFLLGAAAGLAFDAGDRMRVFLSVLGEVGGFGITYRSLTGGSGGGGEPGWRLPTLGIPSSWDGPRGEEKEAVLVPVVGTVFRFG